MTHDRSKTGQSQGQDSSESYQNDSQQTNKTGQKGGQASQSQGGGMDSNTDQNLNTDSESLLD